jgi:hypothetical protein
VLDGIGDVFSGSKRDMPAVESGSQCQQMMLTQRITILCRGADNFTEGLLMRGGKAFLFCNDKADRLQMHRKVDER